MSSPAATTQSSAWNRWWHALSARQPSQSGWPSAIRRGGLVGLICVIGAATGTYAEAAVIAIGALNIGLVDGAVPRRTLTKALLLVAILGSLIAGISALLAGSWWTVPMLMFFAYLMGSYGSLGLVAFNTTFMSLVMAVLFTNDPGNLANAVRLATLVLIGSLLQAGISLLAWRYERESIIRRAIGLAIEEILRAVRNESEELGPKLSAAAYCNHAEAALSGARLSPQRERLYSDVVNELNWARLCITGWLTVGGPTQAQRDEVIAELRHIDNLIRSNPLTKTPLETDPSQDPSWLSVKDQLKRLGIATQELHDRKFHLSDSHDDLPATNQARSASHSAHSRPPRRALSVSVHDYLRILLPSSPTFRHALRLTLAIGVAQAIVMIANIDRGYWVPLTVVMVVKPDFKTTFVRGGLRITGTVAAIVIIGGIMVATGSTAWVMAALVVITAPLTMRWMTANYAFAAFAITSTVLLLVEGGDPDDITYLLRLQNTLIGVAIGIAAYAAIPSWTVDRVKDVLINAVQTQREWTTLTLAAWQNQTLDLPKLRAAGEASRQAAITARPVLESASLEPHHESVDPLAALDVLDACQRAAIAGIALEVELHDKDAGLVPLDSAVVSFVTHDFDLTLAALTDEGFERGTPAHDTASPPAQVRTAVAEIADERIRRSVEMLTANVESAAQIAPRVSQTATKPPS